MITLDKVTKRFGPKILFENVSMQFDPGKRYGITGANGAGKSTLIKMLAGEEDTDVGAVSMPGNTRLGVLRQNHFAYDKERILDAVLMGNKALWEAMQEKDKPMTGTMAHQDKRMVVKGETVFGADIRSGGEDIGDIKDLIVDRDGQISYVVLGIDEGDDRLHHQPLLKIHTGRVQRLSSHRG